MKLSTKTLLASCTLAFATSAMAMDADTRSRKEAYNDAINSANSNYDHAITSCKSLSGQERRDCRNEAKTARRQAVQEAREQRTYVYTEPGRTPADRKEMQASNPKARQSDDPTP